MALLFRRLRVAVVALLLMVALDMLVWFPGSLSMYKNAVHAIQGRPWRVRWQGGAVAYVAMAMAVTLLGTPAVAAAVGVPLAWVGALVGFSIYAVYNGTTWALLDRYPWQVGVFDTLWGTVLCSFTTVLVNQALP